MPTIAVLVSLLSLAVLVATSADAVFEFLAVLVDAISGARRARDYETWDLYQADFEGVDGGAWPRALLAAGEPDFLPPTPFADFWAALSAPAPDLDALPALECAARFLDVRRALFGGVDAADESLFLVEMACFLGAAGHGARVGADTARATPDAAQYAARRTLVATVDVTAHTVSL